MTMSIPGQNELLSKHLNIFLKIQQKVNNILDFLLKQIFPIPFQHLSKLQQKNDDDQYDQIRNFYTN